MSLPPGRHIRFIVQHRRSLARLGVILFYVGVFALGFFVSEGIGSVPYYYLHEKPDVPISWFFRFGYRLIGFGPFTMFYALLSVFLCSLPLLSYKFLKWLKTIDETKS
jgi:hypothetical protein